MLNLIPQQKLILSLCCIVFFFLFLKFGVDTCLPDRGSRLFSAAFRCPPFICDLLIETDNDARKSLWMDAGRKGALSQESDMYQRGVLGIASMAVTKPTVFLGNIPRDITYSGVLLVYLLLLSFSITMLWQWLSDLVEARSYINPEAPPQTKSRKPRASRPQASAVQEVLQRPDDYSEQDEETDE